MKFLSALMLATAATTVSAEPASKVDMSYFYDVAVFEVTLAGDYKPALSAMGQQTVNPDDVHQDLGPTRIDSGQYKGFDVMALVGELRKNSTPTNPPRLVANVAVPKGDTLRVPCGVGSNIDHDFTQAAEADNQPATVMARYLTMFVADREVADIGLGLIGKMEAAGDVPLKFQTHSGETLAVSMLRPGPEGKKEGCVVLLRP